MNNNEESPTIAPVKPKTEPDVSPIEQPKPGRAPFQVPEPGVQPKPKA